MKTTIKNYLTFIGVACLGLLTSKLFGVVPPPDGGYPGFTTAEGTSALQSLTTGVGNTAVGWHSLFANSVGNLNTGMGAGTLLFNTGDNNTATGALALLSNTTGLFNTADGAFALLGNTEGSSNTASGYQALYSNEVGENNAAYGYISLYNNTGSFNTALGSQALVYNTTGSYNIAIGAFAGAHLTTGNNNIDIGVNALGPFGEANTIRIGNSDHHATYLAGIAGQTVGAGGSTCYVDNAGKLGVFLSARRYKEKIQPMDDASGVLFSLKPVTFRYKPEFDKSGTPHFGLVAEEVAEVAPDLVIRNAKGELSTVRYEAVNAMLLNEFLKEHRKAQEQEATITQLQNRMDALVAHIREQDSKIQKVSDGLEMRSATSQVATRQ